MSNTKTEIFFRQHTPLFKRLGRDFLWGVGLVVLAFAGAAINFGLNPISWEKAATVGVSAEMLQVRGEAAALLVDARMPQDFAVKHVPGALNLSLGNWNEGFINFVNVWRPGKRVVVYCDAGCALSEEVAQKLKKTVQGVFVYTLEGDWRALCK